jgi:hypothetical protein
MRSAAEFRTDRADASLSSERAGALPRNGRVRRLQRAVHVGTTSWRDGQARNRAGERACAFGEAVGWLTTVSTKARASAREGLDYGELLVPLNDRRDSIPCSNSDKKD